MSEQASGALAVVGAADRFGGPSEIAATAMENSKNLLGLRITNLLSPS
jgi:hypothetical protein